MGKSGHLLECPEEHLSLYLVRFKDVSAHNYEFALLIDGKLCHFLDHVEPSCAEAGLSVLV